jgi:DNA-binding transcriptional LysR family regulator
VDEGLGATILPQLVADALPQARQKAQVRPLVAPIPVREIGLVTARAALRRRAVDALEAVLGAALSRVLGRAPRRSLVLDPLEEAG